MESVSLVEELRFAAEVKQLCDRVRYSEVPVAYNLLN
jgi:hypothetical protein